MSYDYEGVSYSSLRALCETCGVEYNKLLLRISKGVELKEAVDGLRAKVGLDLRSTSVIAWGKRYESISHLAIEKGVPREYVVKHLVRGCTPEKAILKSMESGVWYEGKKYSGIMELAASRGLPGKLIHNRLYHGMDLHEAVTRPVQRKSRKSTIIIRGKTYTTYTEAFLDQGFESSFIGRIKNEYGFSSNEAAFDFAAQFFDRYQGERPLIIRAVPYVIYNGEWIDKKFEFYKRCGVLNVSGLFKGVSTPLARMQAIKSKTRKEYFDGGSGCWLTSTQYFNANRGSTSIRSKVPSREVLVYPGCTFNPTGYCANISSDWRDDIKRIKG